MQHITTNSFNNAQMAKVSTATVLQVTIVPRVNSSEQDVLNAEYSTSQPTNGVKESKDSYVIYKMLNENVSVIKHQHVIDDCTSIV